MPLSVPRSISPSRVTAFTTCPLAFRLRAIDRLPEQPSAHALKGTLVHRVLELLMWEHRPGTRSRAAATAALAWAWAELTAGAQWAELDLPDEEVEAFRRDAAVLIDNYFALEDPDRVRTVGVELRIEADLGGLVLRGILDRLDVTGDGRFVVVDYKTGRAPSIRHEQAKLTGVHLYALLCEQALGQVPVEVRLLHLREPLSICAVPTTQTIRGQRQRTLAVWQAIERACTQADFRPRPSALCEHCSFHAWCPVYGGEPPALS